MYATDCGIWGPALPNLSIVLHLTGNQTKYGMISKPVAAVSALYLDRFNRERVYLLALLYTVLLLGDGTNDRIEELLKVGAVLRLVGLLGHKYWQVLAASRTTIGQVVVRTYSHSKAIKR